MPHLSRVAIRCALLYLLLGLTIGMLLLANKGLAFSTRVWRLRPARVEFLLMGWTAQLALGVAHWLVPRFRGGAFGRYSLAQFAFVLLNAGVFLTVLGPLLGAPPCVYFAGRLAQVGAVISYLFYISPRIWPLGDRS